MSLVAVLVGTGLWVPPATAVVPVLREEPTTSPIVVPPLVTEPWNGQTGVDLVAERWRKAVGDVAALAPEPEVRDAANAALASADPQAIQKFATVEKRQLETQIAARKKQVAADNLVKIKAMAGTGGASFNAEVQRVLAGTDGDREAFLAYGADIARAQDEKVAANAKERATQLRERLRTFAATAPAESQLRAVAEQALAGDDAAVAAFWNTGYPAAAKADAEERERYLRDLEARNKAAEELSDLAQRAQKASEARTRLLAAHGEGVRALQRASNAMAGAANAARHAQRVLAGTGTVAAKATELAAAQAQTANDLRAAQAAAEQARVAAGTASSAADTLHETGLTYGAEWSVIAQGMSEAAAAAVGATQTAQHAIDATIATNKAQGAQAQAEAHAQQAIKWRQHAEQHAQSAAKLAAAAAKQAVAAKTAAARAKQAREQAQAAEAKAWAGAEKARQQRQVAEAKAAEARQQRQIAEAERANAARHRAEADRQAAAARNARANADAQAAIANGALQRAETATLAAGGADERAWAKEGEARQASEAAASAERARQTADAKRQAMRAAVAHGASDQERKNAQDAADAADQEFTVADGAAKSARGYANSASGAAANARAAATQARAAADRAWAAAERARAAARAADAAADKAEAAAKATHAARLKADAKAAKATAEQIAAAKAAAAATNLAERAADEAVRALWSADRTKDEAQAATTEAVTAAAQADIAIAAAAAASQSSAGIAEPHNAAIALVSPFAGADIDADFVKQVAEQAKSIGEEQAKAAEARAAEAVTAAEKAEAAAQKANAQVKPAYAAAAQAARSAADAAKSAAEAKRYAAQAAVDGAAARAAAASAAKADAQARADAAAARQAANEAANDAAIAGRAAQQAQAEADAADRAATAAEADAAAADAAADRAEADAKAAKDAADRAQKHADSAAAAAASALQHSIDAQHAYERAAEADRQRQRDAAADNFANAANQPVPNPDEVAVLDPSEQEELKKLLAEGAESFWDFLKAEAPQLFKDLTGIQDIEDCIRTGDVMACLWAASNFIPARRLFGFMADLGKFGVKITKFFLRTTQARERAQKLLDKAKALFASGCKANSFTPGTRVLLAHGRTRAIEKVRIGDRVRATDPLTGITGSRRVTNTITSAGLKRLVDITVDADGIPGGATATITATAGHPFWVPSLSKWVNAGDLSDRQWLRTSSGAYTFIAKVGKVREVDARVYNLTVAGIPTYYVLAGKVPVLVHNTGLCPKKIDDVFHNPSGRSSVEQFEYHWDKHAKALGISREQYLQDAKDWAAAIAQPGGKRGLNAKLKELADGSRGISYTDPRTGKGGIIGPDGKPVTFWYGPE
ncbi:pretoxin HINT domain-containing protein [Couchioplanes caeruleus]|uniref:Pretoxin HINT domain-containing protein n=3 Tax=Couchioplanes caeruleus TaxID=56438 RepID=A0A3N1GTG7_9ACTN|nr:pretoxin HINT domain-containing protein [Couchioplanes caeruleus]